MRIFHMNHIFHSLNDRFRLTPRTGKVQQLVFGNYRCIPSALEVAVEGGPMHREIGSTAGLIWNALNAKGELSLARLQKVVGCKTPVFDWAIGWLAREDKIVIICEGRTFRVDLKGTETKAAGAN